MKKIIMIFLLLNLTLSLSACGNVSYNEATWEDADEPMWEETDSLFDSDSEYLSFREVSISQDFDDSEEGEMMFRAHAPSSRSENDVNPTIIADRVIHRANIGIVVDDFDESTQQVQELTTELAGFIEHSHIAGESSSSFGRVADFTIRVPAEWYDEMLEQLAALGDLNYLNTTAVNVSSQYADIVSRLNSLRTQEERVLELVESAEDLADLLLLEERLGELIYEIELLTGERNYLDNQISYSTIDVTISEYMIHIIGDDIDLQPLGDVFMDSLRTLRTFGGIIIRVFVALIPWLIPASVVFLFIRMLWRKRRKKAEGEGKKQRLGKNKPV